jgi:hypothetical protein
MHGAWGLLGGHLSYLHSFLNITAMSTCLCLLSNSFVSSNIASCIFVNANWVIFCLLLDITFAQSHLFIATMPLLKQPLVDELHLSVHNFATSAHPFHLFKQKASNLLLVHCQVVESAGS